MSSAALIVVIGSALWVLVKVSRPWQAWRIAMILGGAAAYVAMFTLPPLARFFELDPWNPVTTPSAVGAMACAIALIELVGVVHRRLTSRKGPAER